MNEAEEALLRLQEICVGDERAAVLADREAAEAERAVPWGSRDRSDLPAAGPLLGEAQAAPIGRLEQEDGTCRAKLETDKCR